MKKTLSLILALVLCLTLCSCSSNQLAENSLEGACKKADELVKEWDAKGKQVCGYESHYDESGLYFVSIRPLTVEDMTAGGKYATATVVSEWVYEELTEILSPLDVEIAILVLDENEDVYYITVDNEPVDLDDLR